MTCLEDVIKPSALKAAWAMVSRGKLGKASAMRQGSDGQSLRSFAVRADAEVAAISARLRRGTYKFSGLDPFFVPKPNGKSRIICAPTVADRIVQRSILDVISKRQTWMANPVSYGFVSDRGVELAAKKAQEYRKAKPWVFKTDITKFFDCVDRDLLRKKVKQHVRQASLHPLILAAIDCEILTTSSSQEKRIKQQGIHTGQGVRQGMPLSPLFANLFLARFDKTCVANKISVLRYADDLIFFAGSHDEAREYENFCTAELASINLGIPKLVDNTKTVIYQPDESAEFLGVELAQDAQGSYQIRLGKQQLEAIKSSIYDMGSLVELRHRQLDVTRFGNSLASKCASYLAAYEFCSNALHLESSLKDWARVAKVKVAAALGIDVTRLTPDGRWFLGVD